MPLVSPRRTARRSAGFCVGLVLAATAALAAEGGPLSLDEALNLGERASPRLAAQGAALAAARELVPRAGQLPDPKLRFGIDNLPVSGPDAFRYNTDSMTMGRIGLMQEFPNGEKRKLRESRAARERDVEAASLAAQRAGVQREVALAWLELYYARQVRAPLADLAKQLQLQLDTVSAAIASGRQTTGDALALRGAVEGVQDRIIEQDRAVERARLALAAWLPADAARPLADPPDTSRFERAPSALLADLRQHPDQRVYAEREALARADLALAASAKKLDWSVELLYGQRAPAFDNMVTLMLSVDLPWEAEKRQDRDTAAKRLLAEQAIAQAEEARRALEAELRATYVDWQTAGVRVERFETLLLPLARERVAAGLAAYRGGRGELAMVLEARRAETETRIAALQAKLERARAWAKLNFLQVEVQP